MTPSIRLIEAEVARALAEDIGPVDASAELIEPGACLEARLITRDAGVLAGRAWAESAFRQLCEPQSSGRIELDWRFSDGDRVEPGQLLAVVSGPARAILSAERSALNFLQLLSGVATRTAAYVDAVAGTGARILDTRKTLPGLRLAQKYAVRMGGGSNHRLGLSDLIMLKENHIAAAGGIAQAVDRARQRFPTLMVEVEVENSEQLEQALSARADRILLDNFELDELVLAVRRVRQQAVLEASGNITLETVRAVAETGVDDISVGELTKSITPLDLSLRFSD